MTPLRDNLDRAKAAYQRARYRGSLADDVLGARVGPTLNKTTGTSSTLRSNIRLWASGLAIAASLAIGLSIHRYATRSTPANPTVAIDAQGPTVGNDLTGGLSLPRAAGTDSMAGPTNQTTTGDATAGVATAEADFTLVPDGASLVGEGASVVPSLTSVASAGGSSDSFSTSDFSLSVPAAPMLFSIDALVDQEQSATITDNQQATSSEGRS